MTNSGESPGPSRPTELTKAPPLTLYSPLRAAAHDAGATSSDRRPLRRYSTSSSDRRPQEPQKVPPRRRLPLPPATPPHGSPPIAPARLTARAHGKFSPRGRITTSHRRSPAVQARCSSTRGASARSPPCRAGVAWHARRGDWPRSSSLFTVTGSVRRPNPPSSYSSTCFVRGCHRAALHVARCR